MAEQMKGPQPHPANAVFALMDDRQFRYSVIQPALEADKHELCRHATGKNQVRGFRNLAKAPTSLLLPVISDEANLSAELARRILEHWMERERTLRERVTETLREHGYEPVEQAFDDAGMVRWNTVSKEHAEMQYDGKFIDGEDKNAVMLMSLLLGWFGSEDEEETEETIESENKQRKEPEQEEA